MKFPLGLTKDTIYDQKEINTNSNDLFVIFPDGLSDFQNKSKEFYGYNRILNFLRKLDTSSLSAQQIKQKIINDVHQFSNGAEQFDDMTVVIVKVL